MSKMRAELREARAEIERLLAGWKGDMQRMACARSALIKALGVEANAMELDEAIAALQRQRDEAVETRSRLEAGVMRLEARLCELREESNGVRALIEREYASLKGATT